MPDTRTDAEKINDLRTAFRALQKGEISTNAFVVIVGNTVDPLPVTEADFEWARNKARELGLL